MTRTLFVMALLIAIAQIGYAQATELGTLYLSGKVVNENKRGMETEIYVYRNGKRSDAFKTSRIGRFEFGIPLQDSVAFVVIAEEYVSKTVFVDARVPENDEDKDYRFPFFIDLFPVGNIPSNIDLKRPVGKIIYSGTQFIYDIEFTNRQNKLLKEFVRERKELKVRNTAE